MINSMVVDLTIPLLESGDHLTRPEFERRYQAMPDDTRAELVEGVVYVASPVRVTHGRPHAQAITWLGVYCAATPGVDMADNATVRLDLDNEPQPDICLRIEPEVGGKSSISEDEYIEGAPELVVEIANTSAAYDLATKLSAYRRSGVQEYLVWQVYEQRIDWFQLCKGEYVSLPAKNGLICSYRFPGLWLAVDALLQGDMPQVLATGQQGLATTEHQQFLQTLQQNGID